jgi:N-acetylneuraminic acid mutarotase
MGIRDVGDDIYAFYNGYWLRAGDMKEVVYYGLKLKRQIRP